MIAVKGIYKNGVVHLERSVIAKKSIKVIVTFLDEELPDDAEHLKISDFSFIASREKSKRYKGSLADAVIEERKSER